MQVPSDWRELIIVHTAMERGLIKALGSGPRSAEEVAALTHNDQRAVWNILEALVATGYLKRVDRGYELTPEAHAFFLEPGAPGFRRHSLEHSFELLRRWQYLPQVVAEGKPAPRPEPPRSLASFLGAMDDNARESADQVVDSCLERVPAGPRVLDLGGGPGTYSRHFAEKGAQVTMQDQPDTVELVKATFCLDLGIEFFPGNFMEELPTGPFDLALLFNICHTYGPDENINLIRKVARVLDPGGVIAILDFFRGYSLWAAYFGVNMLVSTQSGGAWTEDQYREWVSQAGFKDIQVRDIPQRESQLLTAVLG